MLIVILVVAALATQFLPNIMMSETFINRAADDYNQASALRYVSGYKSLTEKFPSNFHTGLAENAVACEIMREMTLDCAILYAAASPAAAPVDPPTGDYLWDGINRFPWQVNAAVGVTDAAALTITQANSLAKAGIVSLAYGPDSAGLKPAYSALAITDVVKKFAAATDIYYGARYNEATNDITAAPAANVVTLGGQALSVINPAVNVVVPLFVTPDIAWQYYYEFDGTPNATPDYVNDGTGAAPDPTQANTWSGESRLGMMLPPKDPRMSKDGWNYYMCLFLVDSTTAAANSDQAFPARFLGTLSPELIAINP